MAKTDIVTDNNILTGVTINKHNTNELVTGNNCAPCDLINNRNTDKKWSQSDAIVNRQLICHKCGRTIKPDEPIVKGQKGQIGKYNIFQHYTYHDAVIYCTDCKIIEDKDRIFPNYRLKNCITCGRPVYRLHYKHSVNNVFCCYGCQYDYYNKKVSQAKKETRIKTCPVCGSVFSAQRSDTKFCTNACKQKYYRNGTK